MNGYHSRGSNRSYLPITQIFDEQSDGVTAISQYLQKQTVKDFEIKRPIEVIPNFVNCDLYTRSRILAQRPNGARRRAIPDALIEFPAR